MGAGRRAVRAGTAGMERRLHCVLAAGGCGGRARRPARPPPDPPAPARLLRRARAAQVRGHAVSVLQGTDDEELLHYLLQLVQVGGWRVWCAGGVRDLLLQLVQVGPAAETSGYAAGVARGRDWLLQAGAAAAAVGGMGGIAGSCSGAGWQARRERRSLQRRAAARPPQPPRPGPASSTQCPHLCPGCPALTLCTSALTHAHPARRCAMRPPTTRGWPPSWWPARGARSPSPPSSSGTCSPSWGTTPLGRAQPSCRRARGAGRAAVTVAGGRAAAVPLHLLLPPRPAAAAAAAAACFSRPPFHQPRSAASLPLTPPCRPSRSPRAQAAIIGAAGGQAASPTEECIHQQVQLMARLKHISETVSVRRRTAGRARCCALPADASHLY